MAENLTLDEFLRRLGSERGLHRKVRLLGRYWKQVQNLPPEQRERVALALGSQALWNRLESLFNRDGTLSEGELAVKRALDSVGRADPGELRALARKVRSREYTEVGKDLTKAVGDALDEEAASGDKQPDLEAPPDETEQADLEAPFEEAARADLGAPPEEPEQADLVAPAEEVEQADLKAPSEETVRTDLEAPVAGMDIQATQGPGLAAAVVGGMAPPGRSDAPDGSPTPFDDDPSTTRFDQEPRPPQPHAEDWPAAVPRRADPTAGARRTEDHGTARRFSAAEALATLRHLRDPLDYGAHLGPDGRSQLLEQLGSGWARRRGLSQLIRRGSLSGLDEALRLIDRLETPQQKSWCLGDLMEHWQLDETETSRVLEAAPSQATRRRLQHRAERRS